MCHMFLLNVEFSNACRLRVFQCHFSTVSRFPFPGFQLPQCIGVGGGESREANAPPRVSGNRDFRANLSVISM